MTDDLVKRLRDFEQWLREPAGKNLTLSSDLFDEAADRIEALEAALLEIFDHECRTSDRSFIACTARDALWPRATLGDKKDE